MKNASRFTSILIFLAMVCILSSSIFVSASADDFPTPNPESTTHTDYESMYESDGQKTGNYDTFAGGSACCNCNVSHEGSIPDGFPKSDIVAVSFYAGASRKNSYFNTIEVGPTKLKLKLGESEAIATSVKVTSDMSVPKGANWHITFHFDPPVNVETGTTWELLDGDNNIYSALYGLHSGDVNPKGLPGFAETFPSSCQYARINKPVYYSAKFYREGATIPGSQTEPEPDDGGGIIATTPITAPTDIHGGYDEDDCDISSLDIRGIGLTQDGDDFELTIQLASNVTLNDPSDPEMVYMGYMYGIMVDSDQNTSTGIKFGSLGADYAVNVTQRVIQYFKTPSTKRQYLVNDGYTGFNPPSDDTLIFSFPKLEIGNAETFNFVVYTAIRNAQLPWNLSQCSDIMPDFRGYFEYKQGDLIPHVPFDDGWCYFGQDIMKTSGEEFLWFVPKIPYSKYAPLKHVEVQLYDTSGQLVGTIVDTDGSYSNCRYLFDPHDIERKTCTAGFFYGPDAGFNPGFYFDTTQYADGDYELRAIFSDEAGTEIAESILISIDNVNDRPDVYILSPQKGATVSGSTEVWIAATDDDPNDGISNLWLNAPGLTTDCYDRYRSHVQEELGMDIGSNTACKLCWIDLDEIDWESMPPDNRYQMLQAVAEDMNNRTRTSDRLVRVDICKDFMTSITNPECTDADGDGIMAHEDCDDYDGSIKYTASGDTDGDGVTDCVDVCPEDVGVAVPGEEDWKQGCPNYEEWYVNRIEQKCKDLEIFGMKLEGCELSNNPNFYDCLTAIISNCFLEVTSEFCPAVPPSCLIEMVDLVEDFNCDVSLNTYKAKAATDKKQRDQYTLVAIKNTIRIVADATDNVLIPLKIPTFILCMDNALGFSDEFLKLLVSATYDALGGFCAIFGSAGHIDVYDEQGRHVGLTEQGTIETNIPDSYYGEIRGLIVVWLPDTQANYRIVVNGDEAGDFDLDLRSNHEASLKVVKYNKVEVTDDTEAVIPVGQESDLIMHIDLDGDGSYETLKSPDEIIVDSDSDGIIDGMDFCSDTPIGCTVDKNGCAPDSDMDGICDDLDEEPDALPSPEESKNGGSGIAPIIGGIAGIIVLIFLVITLRRRCRTTAIYEPSSVVSPEITSTPPTELQTFCLKCGTPNLERAEFCKKCGSELNK